MEIKIFKCVARNMSWGVRCDDWLPSHVIFPIVKGAKYISIKDGYVSNMPVIDAKTGDPIPATEIVKKFLIQNKSVSNVDQNGLKTFDYYDRLFFIDYKPNLKEFFEENRLPIPADQKGVAERMLGTYTDTLKAFGLEEDALSPGQKAIVEAKKEAEPAKEVEAKKEAEPVKKPVATKA